jgi:hypothetical protein
MLLAHLTLALTRHYTRLNARYCTECCARQRVFQDFFKNRKKSKTLSGIETYITATA